MKSLAALLLTGLLSAQSQVRLTDQRIVQLVTTGVSEQEILRIIQTASSFDFDLRPPSTDAMLRSGVSEDIIKAMAARESDGSRRAHSATATNLAPKPPSPPPSMAAPSVSADMTGAGRSYEPPRPIFSPLPDLPQDVDALAAVPQSAAENESNGETLSDRQVAELIQDGVASNRPLGVLLTDLEPGRAGSVACRGCTVTIYTREDWIRLAARNARLEMHPFSVADVPPAIRMPLLYVTVPQNVAQPSPSRNGYSSARRIVLRDLSGRSMIQPIELPDDAIRSNLAFKLASAANDTAAFQVSDANALRALDAKGEFLIDVAGSGGNQYFRVKMQNLPALFGDANFAPAPGASPVWASR